MIHEHEQQQESSNWYINHGLNKTDIQVRCWVDRHGTLTRIIPKSVTICDDNTVHLTFLRPQVGKAQVTPSTRWEQFDK